MRNKIVLLGSTLAFALAAGSAQAQKPISLGIAAGVSMPQGNYGDVAGNGYHATAALGLGLPLLPVGLRIEGSYNRFALSEEMEALVGEAGNWSLASATANLTYSLPLPAVVVSPYVIGGGGMYWGSCSADACDTQSDFGYNAGVGVKFMMLVMSAYAEARYHSVQTEGESTNYMPITIGFMF